MDIIINYIASVVFAVVGLVLIGVYSIVVGDTAALKVVLVATGSAWASCYVAAWYNATNWGGLRFASIYLTLLTVVLVAIVVLVRL